MNFKIGSRTNDRFSVNILKNENELDEDDDQDAVVESIKSPTEPSKQPDASCQTGNLNKVSESSNDSLDDSGSHSSFKQKIKVN